MPAAHRFQIRVYYEDTDFSGVVYHANYLRFMERARSELLRELGLHHRALFDGTDDKPPLGFVVRSMHLDFAAPARMDDLLVVETHIQEVGGASVHMNQRILRDEAMLVSADVRVAVVAKGRAVRFPPHMRSMLVRALSAQRLVTDRGAHEEVETDEADKPEPDLEAAADRRIELEDTAERPAGRP